MKKDQKVARNKDFISAFEELGFVYEERVGCTLMKKKDGFVDDREVFFCASKYGHRLYFSVGYFAYQYEGFYLNDFQAELVVLLKSIDTIYDALKNKDSFGFFNKKITLENETIYISEQASFSTERGFLVFSNYK